MQRSVWRRFGIALGASLLALVLIFLVFNSETNELDRVSKSQAPGTFIVLESGETHYQIMGPDHAPLVVLVHGFSVPSYVWEPTSIALERAGYQVLIYDLYGRGYSERVDGVYEIDLFTTQLDDLLTGLGVEQPVFIGGLSMGGPIAARFAHQHPDRVEKVLLIAPEVVQTTPSDIFPLNLPLVGEYLMRAVMEPLVLPKLQANDFHHPENYPDWEDRYRVQLAYKGTGRALLSTIRNLTENDPEGEYRALNKAGIPALLIWGEEDQTIPWAQIEVLEGILPEMQIEVIPGVGHLPHYEKPGLVNPLLINFLNH